MSHTLILEKIKEYLPAIVALNRKIPSSALRLEKITLLRGLTMKKSINLLGVDELPTK